MFNGKLNLWWSIPVYVYRMLSPMLNHNKVRSATELISAYDHDLNVTLWNPACAQRTGVPEIDAMGKCLYDIFPYAKEDQRTRFLKIAMQVNQNFFFPNMIYLYTQPYTYYTQYIHPIKANGQIVGVINIVRDHIMEEFYTADEFLHFFNELGHEHGSAASLQHDQDRPHI